MTGRLDPANQRPTALSRRAGLAVEVALAVLVAVRVAETRSVVEAVVTAVPYFMLFVVIWWAVGKWFSLVLGAQVLPLVVGPLLTALDISGDPFALPMGPVLLLPLVFVGFVATRMDRLLAAPLARVDSTTLVVPVPVADDLVVAGFRRQPDLGYAMAGQPVVTATFTDPGGLIFVDVGIRASVGAVVSLEVISLLDDGGTLETLARCTSPAGPGRRRQVFPKSDLGQLLSRHREALAWLGRHGIAPMPVDASSYFYDVDRRLEDEAATIRRHPLRSAAWAWVLMLLRRDRDEGPIQDRAGARENSSPVEDKPAR
jgi:hypothetical protein